MVSHKVLAAFSLALGLVLTPLSAKAERLTIKVAAPCVEAPDLARCLLTILAAHEGGGDLLFDGELGARPDLLAAVGVSRESLQAWLASGEGQTAANHVRDRYLAWLAAEVALDADAAGRPPGRALAPVLALPHQHETPIRISQRIEALRAIAMRGDERYFGRDQRRRPSEPLLRAALQAWDDLDQSKPAPEPSIFGVPPSATDHNRIAKIWLRLGQTEKAEEVLARRARPGDLSRIGSLWTLGRLDEAVALALNPDLTADRAAALVEARRIAAVTGQNQQPDAEDEVRKRLARLRSNLAHAAHRDGRTDLAARLGDAVLSDAHPRDDDLEVSGIIRYASPAVARAWLERWEATPSPVADERLGAMPPVTFLTEWKRIDPEAYERRLQAAMVEEKTQAAARAQTGRRSGWTHAAATHALLAEGRVDEALALGTGQARDYLAADLASGNGLERLDRYLAGINEREQAQVLRACAAEAAKLALWSEGVACLRRGATLAQAGPWRHTLASEALSAAALAARAGAMDAARPLFRLAVELDGSGERLRQPDGVERSLLQIALADLRARGLL